MEVAHGKQHCFELAAILRLKRIVWDRAPPTSTLLKSTGAFQ
jgi:hypothetical protein